MKYDELICILKEKVTDDMFEALVLNMIFNMNKFKIVFCDISYEELKIYTLQHWPTGKEIHLIINPTCKVLNETIFPNDKYMIANKDEDTLFYLVNELNGAHSKEYPDTLHWLIPVLAEFEEDRLTAMDHIIYRFTKKTDNILNRYYKEYQHKFKESYNKAIDCMLSRLVKEEYLNNESEWDKKKNKVRLTGKKGKNRVCYCQPNSNCSILFFVEEPFELFDFYINNEHDDYELFADKIIKTLEKQNSF